MALPVNIDDVDELPASVCQEARNLVGFWLNRGLTQPAKRRSGWARSDSPYRSFFWDQMIRKRIASQVDRVKHWKVIHGSYEDAPDIAAHWHVDPPYAVAGKAYKYNEVDYPALAQWVRTRRGFTQVCEQTGADWLPFRPYAIVNSHRTRPFSSEAVYEFDSEAAE
jgi:hypothetical protein